MYPAEPDDTGTSQVVDRYEVHAQRHAAYRLNASSNERQFVLRTSPWALVWLIPKDIKFSTFDFTVPAPMLPRTVLTAPRSDRVVLAAAQYRPPSTVTAAPPMAEQVA